VAPEHRRRGIGGRLLGLLAGTAQAAGATTLQARTESDRPEVLAFLSRRGFAETMRMHRLVLNVASATLGPYAGVERRLAAEGIVLTTLEDEQHRIGDACRSRLTLSMIGHPSGAAPLMVDVRQSGSGSRHQGSRHSQRLHLWAERVGVLHCIDRVYDIGRRLQSGTVGHNAFRGGDFTIGFGGFKQSGLSREGGVEGLLPYLESKTLLLDEAPSKIG
jgi:hypothetical protein